jgi:hypothetical protein
MKKDDDDISIAVRDDIEGAGDRGVKVMENMLARPVGFEQASSVLAV